MKESNILLYLNCRKIGMLKNFKFKRVTLNRPPGDLDWWIYKSNLYQ